MDASTVGKHTSGAEVSKVSADGFWLRLGDEQLFVPFASFPWFEGATPAQIRNVQRPSDRHLYLPDLDVDLAVESIRDPGAFPLVSRPVA